jgi:hypothetical protein
MMAAIYVPYLTPLRAELRDDVVPDLIAAGGWR